MRRDINDDIMQPGEIIVAKTDIIINEGRPSTAVKVKNVGDRPIQVGSHYHFFEVNTGLKFDREKAYGKKLDIPSGAAVRFEPGDEKTVQLVEYAGKREIYGFHGKVDGPIDESRVFKPELKEKGDEKHGEENLNKKEGYTQEPKENKDSKEKKEKLKEMRKNREESSAEKVEDKDNEKGRDSK